MARCKREFDYSKLIGKVIELYGTRRNYANSTGIDYNRVVGLLTGRVPFSQPEIILWQENLQIVNNDVYSYFFTQKVCKE